MTLDCVEAFREAVQIVGGQNAIARGIGVSQASIWRKLNDKQPIPAEWVLPVEKLSKISRHRLRPDIYPLEKDRRSRDAQ